VIPQKPASDEPQPRAVPRVIMILSLWQRAKSWANGVRTESLMVPRWAVCVSAEEEVTVLHCHDIQRCPNDATLITLMTQCLGRPGGAAPCPVPTYVQPHEAEYTGPYFKTVHSSSVAALSITDLCSEIVLDRLISQTCDPTALQ
jgi:hypothetical protein